MEERLEQNSFLYNFKCQGKLSKCIREPRREIDKNKKSSRREMLFSIYRKKIWKEGRQATLNVERCWMTIGRTTFSACDGLASWWFSVYRRPPPSSKGMWRLTTTTTGGWIQLLVPPLSSLLPPTSPPSFTLCYEHTRTHTHAHLPFS